MLYEMQFNNLRVCEYANVVAGVLLTEHRQVT